MPLVCWQLRTSRPTLLHSKTDSSNGKLKKQARSQLQLALCSKDKAQAKHHPRKNFVQLRRGDMAYTPPPWHLSYDATAEQLRTSDMIKTLDSQVLQIWEANSHRHLVHQAASYGW